MTETTTDHRPLALVTGASSGIGREIARELAARGFDLVVAAEDDGLAEAGDELFGTGADVVTVRGDLRDPAAVERLHGAAAATGRPLAVAVLNAGVGRGGAFVDVDLADEREVIDLNVTSTVHLMKLVLRDMVARGDGRVLVTSSIASTMPGSFQAVYNASKSFLQSFVQALQEETKDSGVTLTSLMPGPTDTDFFRRADMLDTPVGEGEKDDPAQVAKQGVDALLDGDDKLVAGSLKTKVQGAANSVLPDSLKAKAHRAMAEPQGDDA